MTGRLLFLAPGDVRKARVEPISFMRTCRAFAERGLDVTLVTPRVRRPDGVPFERVWEHFGIPPSFAIRELPTPLGHESSVRAFRLWAGAAAALLALVTLARQLVRPRLLIVYGRSPILMLPFDLLRRVLPAGRRPRLVFETHVLPNSAGARVARAADLVVVTSRRLERDVSERLGVAPERVLLAPLGPYNEIERHDRDAARAELGLPPGAAIACYSGKMIEEQNEFLMRCAAALKGRVEGFRLLLVGGNPRILEWTRARMAELGVEDEVILTGFVAPPRVDLHVAAADVLVMHMSEDLPHYDYCTPAKGFDYQAAGRPIVATDIPLFEEVFGADGERAIRVRERTPEALADAIEDALRAGEGGRAMAERAVEFARGRTWEGRVDAVLRALEPR